MILDGDVVELEDELAVDDDLLVLLASMAAFGAQELGVEATRRRHVVDDDERLRPGRPVHPTNDSNPLLRERDEISLHHHEAVALERADGFVVERSEGPRLVGDEP